MQEKNNHTNITKHRKQVFGPYSSGTRYFQIVAVKKNLQYEVREREREREFQAPATCSLKKFFLALMRL